MAKNDLVGGTIWDEYSNVVVERMNNPHNKGEITQEEADEKGLKLIIADFGAESCGDAVRLYWLVDEKTDTIVKAKFKSFGCGTAIASSDIMTELCLNKTVDEAVKITNIDVEFAMRDEENTPAVPPQKMHCSVMAYDVIKRATAIYKGIDEDSIETEKIICECARVTVETVREVVKLNNLSTIEEITAYTKAGAFCKSCIRPGGHEKRDIYLVDVLDECLREREESKLREASDNALKGVEVSFANQTLVQKLKRIEAVIEENIRPMLVMDGGNLEVLDLKESDDGYFDIYIRYLGACASCATGSTGTLYAIEATLKEKLDDKIRVLPI